MKFAILGAGAIGAYLGSSLSRSGTDVTLIARGDHLRAMQANGVTVLSPSGDFTAHPPATDELGAVSEADVVFIGLKAYSLTELAPRIGPLLQPGTAVIAGQNGIPWWYFHGVEGPLAGARLESVDPGGVIDAAIPRSSVIGCVVYPATEIVAPGVVRHIEGNRFQIGEPSGDKSERCGSISAAFTAAGLRCPVEARLRDHIWLKLVGNAAFNPVSVLTRATLGQLGQLAEMRELLRGLLEESAAVAAALGVRLPVKVERRLEAGLAVGDHKTSMLQDFDAGKRLELGCMTGAIIEIADRVGIPVPRTETVHACAVQLELSAQLGGNTSS